MNHVVFFDQPEAAIGSLVGGKGNNLLVLSAAGFPVPPGFVVTAAAYDAFLESVGWLEPELAAFDYERPDRLRDQCADLRARLSKIGLPPAVDHAIRAGVTRLDGGATARLPCGPPRPSKTWRQAAFAGQHDTYLNIRGANRIPERVRDCFVSLWEDRAVLYRHHQGFRQRDARMAVVVQRQIECEIAGVGFSVNPISGRVDRMLLNANFGLGESVVSGQCEVDQFRTRQRDAADRRAQYRPQAGDDRPLPRRRRAAGGAGRPERHALSERRTSRGGRQAAEARRVALRLAAGYRMGFEGGSALPVAIAARDDARGWRWTRDDSAERFPIAMTPLCWDFMRGLSAGRCRTRST